jgi:Glyoxalase-like domain
MNKISRRLLLQLFGSTGIAFLFNEKFAIGGNLPQIDHLLLGSSDLESTMIWFEQKTGVKPVIGGSHPGRGTRNALVSLGEQRYLELIAPDPVQRDIKSDMDLQKLTQPRLITWAAATSDIDATANIAHKAGYEIFGPRDGSRKRPDGKVLKWKTVGVQTQFAANGVDPFPFFIQWTADSVHPSVDSPKGCTLQSFQIGHPDSKGLKVALEKFGLSTEVNRADTVQLIAVLNTPKGIVKLS